MCRRSIVFLACAALGGFLSACGTEAEPNDPSSLFQSLSSRQTGIDFINQLESTEEFNTYTFRNFYNGAGVAIGDVNNDGWVDLYFCGNSVDNKLYLNQGDFQFEDVTEKAGVACADVWSTGVSMADINGDGWLDIYVCKSGPPGGVNRYNELFINQQDGTFREAAKKWGIADEGLSVHAVFFDYDKDGDLDMYLLNNSLRSIGTGSDLQKHNREMRDPNGGNKLYRHDGDHYTDVSEAAGIYGSQIGFGLGVTIGDVNRDGWQDIFVSNDFFERDYLYINQQNGTFKEDLENYIREISMGSMGADMADLNNDGYPEIFVTEMLPEHDARYKTKTQFHNWDYYQRQVQNGFYHQFGRNVLQLNNGDGTFSEIGRLAGVEATDWSWGALIFDMDADGWKDLFVANGIYKDLLDQDYLNFYSNPDRVRELINTEEQAVLKLIDEMPSEPLANYAFHNNGDFTFSNVATDWGLAEPGFSNGSAYGDLDNDGDPDLVVNNINMPPFLYRNNSRELTGNHTVSVQLKGSGGNTFGLGAQLTLYAGDKKLYQEQAPMRGFQSCVDHRLHFGLGDINQVDSLVVLWNDGRKQVLKDLPVDQLTLIEETGEQAASTPAVHQELQHPLFHSVEGAIDYRHVENTFSDFDRDRLLFQMVSAEGPKVARADINGDGREDVFIGGAKDAAGVILVQRTDGRFESTNQELLAKDKVSEDAGCLFFDADGDGDQDLYVASGGNEFPSSSSALIDRLYLNDGSGHFTKDGQLLPTSHFESSSCVQAADYDGDGDLDLFVGIRLRPFLYGVPASSYILENDGSGKFNNVSEAIAPDLKDIGLVTDARWADVDADQDQDLIIAGEWMPITILVNDNGRFRRSESQDQLDQYSGFWNAVAVADLDQDGDQDFIAGNHGLNSRFVASGSTPVHMYINDFDHNQSVEQILTQFEDGRSYPMVLRTDLVMQMPALKKKYLKFKDYREQTIEDIFVPDQLARAIRLDITETRTMLFENLGNGTFSARPLPAQAQFSPMYGIALEDFDGDGHTDILLGGNLYRSKPEVGIYDASYGVYLKGDGALNFTAVPAAQSGLCIKGEVRDFALLAGKRLLVAKNNGPLEVFEY
ncbi:MAG: VCBS repeat-containing protein [Saprospiraceae bacterium]|nr:VCBS repeat-containing protein [Lewinella sp.]